MICKCELKMCCEWPEASDELQLHMETATKGTHVSAAIQSVVAGSESSRTASDASEPRVSALIQSQSNHLLVTWWSCIDG